MTLTLPEQIRCVLPVPEGTPTQIAMTRLSDALLGALLLDSAFKKIFEDTAEGPLGCDFQFSFHDAPNDFSLQQDQREALFRIAGICKKPLECIFEGILKEQDVSESVKEILAILNTGPLQVTNFLARQEPLIKTYLSKGFPLFCSYQLGEENYFEHVYEDQEANQVILLEKHTKTPIVIPPHFLIFTNPKSTEQTLMLPVGASGKIYQKAFEMIRNGKEECVAKIMPFFTPYYLYATIIKTQNTHTVFVNCAHTPGKEVVCAIYKRLDPNMEPPAA